MGELSRSFKPETMRVFVRLDEDGKYHEVENISSFGIKEDGDWFTRSRGTITLGGIDLHTSDDSFIIEKEFVKSKYGYRQNFLAPLSCDELNRYLADDSSVCGVVTCSGLKLLSKRDRYKDHLPERVIVSGTCVISFWKDGTKTISRCHDGDEMDVRTGILLNAIKKWMPGGTYWQDVMDDVTVEYQGKREKIEPNFKRPDNLEAIGHGEIEHHPCRPYMRGGRYGDDEKMAVIEDVESGMTQAAAARKHGISQGTVSGWMKEWRSGNA